MTASYLPIPPSKFRFCCGLAESFLYGGCDLIGRVLQCPAERAR